MVGGVGLGFKRWWWWGSERAKANRGLRGGAHREGGGVGRGRVVGVEFLHFFYIFLAFVLNCFCTFFAFF